MDGSGRFMAGAYTGVKTMTVRDYIDRSKALWVHLRQAEAIYCCTLPRAMDVERLLWDLRTPGPSVSLLKQLACFVPGEEQREQLFAHSSRFHFLRLLYCSQLDQLDQSGRLSEIWGSDTLQRWK